MSDPMRAVVLAVLVKGSSLKYASGGERIVGIT